MTLTTEFLDELSCKAANNERLRTSYDMRTNGNDQSQRMLNAMEPKTEVPIHRHTDTSEVVIVLRGSVREIFYDDQGNITETIELHANQEPKAISIPAGTWHTLECLEKGTVIFEAKDGAYVPRRDEDTMTI